MIDHLFQLVKAVAAFRCRSRFRVISFCLFCSGSRFRFRRFWLCCFGRRFRLFFLRSGRKPPRLRLRPVIFQQLIHAHLAVHQCFALSGLYLLVAAVRAHLAGIDVIPQLQLQNVGKLPHQHGILHAHAHLTRHSVLRVRKSPDAI